MLTATQGERAVLRLPGSGSGWCQCLRGHSSKLLHRLLTASKALDLPTSVELPAQAVLVSTRLSVAICSLHEPEQLGLEDRASSSQLQLSGTHYRFTFAPRPSVAVSLKQSSRLIFSGCSLSLTFTLRTTEQLSSVSDLLSTQSSSTNIAARRFFSCCAPTVWNKFVYALLTISLVLDLSSRLTCSQDICSRSAVRAYDTLTGSFARYKFVTCWTELNRTEWTVQTDWQCAVAARLWRAVWRSVRWWWLGLTSEPPHMASRTCCGSRPVSVDSSLQISTVHGLLMLAGQPPSPQTDILSHTSCYI